MENNQLLDADLTPEENDERQTIELLSDTQFTVLNVASFGLYGVWWMYKSWKFFKEKDGLDIMPAARAIFAIIFTFSLFEKIQNYAQANGYTSVYSSGGLFGAFFVLNLLSRLPDPYWLISLFAFACLIPPFNALNYAIANSAHYNGVEQGGYNSRQTVVLVLGGLFWILVLVGLFYPIEEY